MTQKRRWLQFQIAASTPPLLLALWILPAFAADPFASNNGLYPTETQWRGSYRGLSYDYPETAENNWYKVAPRTPLSIQNAAKYVTTLKAFVRPAMEGMINAADTWSPATNGWYGMLWQGEGTKGPNGAIDLDERSRSHSRRFLRSGDPASDLRRFWFDRGYAKPHRHLLRCACCHHAGQALGQSLQT